MLNDRSQEIAKVAKNIDDLANRSSLIALNASVHAVGTRDTGTGFSLLAEEVERLSDRAEGASRQMSALTKSIAAEIEEVESVLHTTVAEVANISKFTLESGNSLGELERYIGQFMNLQSKLAENSNQQTAETEQALQVFTASLSESARVIGNLRETGAGISDLSNLMENLKSSVADFRLPQPAVPDTAPAIEEPAAEYVNFAESAEPVEQFQIQGDA
jgi:twitching motility protein PilJ